jgi:RNA polymerase sigma-70 factor (ECF subfamily)
LLQRVRAGDGDAWTRLAKLYGPLVYGWCRRRGLQAEDAADVAQEVFRAVAQHIDRFDGGSFRGWLWTITRNRIFDHFRRVQRRPSVAGGSNAQEQLQQIPEALEESEAEANAVGGLVRRALELIRPDFRETTWQAFWRVMMEDQAPADVARSLGISVNAVYIAKARVLRRLRDELGEDLL